MIRGQWFRLHWVSAPYLQGACVLLVVWLDQCAVSVTQWVHLGVGPVLAGQGCSDESGKERREGERNVDRAKFQ